VKRKSRIISSPHIFNCYLPFSPEHLTKDTRSGCTAVEHSSNSAAFKITTKCVVCKWKRRPPPMGDDQSFGVVPLSSRLGGQSPKFCFELLYMFPVGLLKPTQRMVNKAGTKSEILF